MLNNICITFRSLLLRLTKYLSYADDKGYHRHMINIFLDINYKKSLRLHSYSVLNIAADNTTQKRMDDDILQCYWS